MYTLLRSPVIALAIIIIAIAADGQVATGTYNYGTFDNKGFDTINVGNLNVHFAIPVLNKAGRGVPFTYDLSYDSSIWVPVSVSGVEQWQPVGNWGWNAQTAPLAGYVTASETVTTTPGPPCTITTDTWSNYVYHDAMGRAHPFNVITWTRYIPCDHPPIESSGAVIGTATDGSGFGINTGLALVAWTITSPSGKVLTGPTDGQSGAGTFTDSNGNEITVNSSLQFTDMTGNVALTVAGGAPNPSTLTYTDTNGQPQQAKINYASYHRPDCVWLQWHPGVWTGLCVTH